MSQVNHATINLRSTASTTARPLVYNDDGDASATARGIARFVRHQFAHGTSNLHNDVVHNLVRNAQGQTIVTLTRNEALHVYLLGWDWLAGAIQAAANSKERYPMQERLQHLLDGTDVTLEGRWFVDGLLTDGGSIAWMRDILNAVKDALP